MIIVYTNYVPVVDIQGMQINIRPAKIDLKGHVFLCKKNISRTDEPCMKDISCVLQMLLKALFLGLYLKFIRGKVFFIFPTDLSRRS